MQVGEAKGHAAGDVVMMDNWNTTGAYGLIININVHEVYENAALQRYTYDIINSSEFHKDVASFRVFNIDGYADVVEKRTKRRKEYECK